MTGLVDAGDGQFLWQNHVAQFVDCFLFFCPFCVFEFLNSIENLAEVPGRINGELVAEVNFQFPRQLDAEHGRLTLEIEGALFDELVQRNDVFLLRRINTANHRREPAVLELDDHRALHIRRGRNHARRLVDLGFERAPVMHDVLGAH